jgi:hypothetical protein
LRTHCVGAMTTCVEFTTRGSCETVYYLDILQASDTELQFSKVDPLEPLFTQIPDRRVHQNCFRCRGHHPYCPQQKPGLMGSFNSKSIHHILEDYEYCE